MMISDRQPRYTKSQRQSASATRARLWGFAIIIVLFAAAALWREPLSALWWRAVGPILLARHTPSEGEAERAAMRAALADRDALYAENIDLKARLGRSESEERILAGVIMRPPATPYDTIVIDAGFEEGVARGDFVSAGGTTMVGSVSELYAHASRVTLISSPGEKYEGLLHLRSGETLAVAVEGQGGGSLFAQVPSGTQVHVGDSVVLPGVAGGLIARVRQVEAGESDSFSTIYLSLPVSVSSLYFVEVLKRTSHVAQ